MYNSPPPRQKNFMNEPRYFNNVHILNELLNISKKTGLKLFQVGTEKAFDTIPHDIIADAVRFKSIPEKMIVIIMNAYSDIRTAAARRDEAPRTPEVMDRFPQTKT
jgi:hypothetical protein